MDWFRFWLERWICAAQMIGWPRTMVIQYVNAWLLIIPEMCNSTNVDNDIYLVSDEGQQYPSNYILKREGVLKLPIRKLISPQYKSKTKHLSFKLFYKKSHVCPFWPKSGRTTKRNKFCMANTRFSKANFSGIEFFYMRYIL